MPHAVTPSPESARPGSAWQDAKSRAHMHSRERRVTRGSLPSEAIVGPGGSVSGHAHASRQPHKLKIVSTPQKGIILTTLIGHSGSSVRYGAVLPHQTLCTRSYSFR